MLLLPLLLLPACDCVYTRWHSSKQLRADQAVRGSHTVWCWRRSDAPAGADTTAATSTATTAVKEKRSKSSKRSSKRSSSSNSSSN
eukprot:1531-Heterococcus_DN1.PRE.2